MHQAHRFQNDPRVAKGKKMILEALQEHQKSLCSIKPATQSGKKELSEQLVRFEKVRGAPLWYPYIGSGIGSGPFVELVDGSVKLDAVGGIGVHIFGHSHPEICSASIDGALENTVMQGHLQQGSRSLELSERLCSLSGMDHCFLSSSGAMACENALKIAFSHRSQSKRIIAFDRCFMGRTLALSQITDKPESRKGLPATLRVDYIPYFDPLNPIESTEKTLSTLKKILHRYKGEHCALCVELIQGEGGVRSGSKEFFKQVFELVRSEGILVLVDEVQTFARSSCAFAYDHFGLREWIDIATIGKASQVCATLYRKHLQPPAGLLSQTYTSSSASIAASLKALELFEEKKLFGSSGRNMQLEMAFIEGMQQLRSDFPGQVHGPYGVGAMLAMTPLNGRFEEVSHFAQQLFEHGVISFIAGSSPTRVRFLLPSLVMEPKHITQILEAISKAFYEAS